MSGWICLYRDITDHWIWKDSKKLKAWIDLVLLANHEYKKFMINGFLIECNRGDLAYSQLHLAERWKWSRQNVRTFLELLKKDGMITVKSNHQTTIISICNYNKYQDYQPTNQPTTNQRVTNDQPTTNQRVTTNNNENNYNNENNETNKTSYVETETVSGEENVISIETKRKQPPPYKEIVDTYHATLPTLAQVYKLTETRKTHIKSLWADELDDIGSWKSYFLHISRSDFLMGRSRPGSDGRLFLADFDFIIKPANFIKIAEEKYHGKKVQR